jgi:hypothetical protein
MRSAICYLEAFEHSFSVALLAERAFLLKDTNFKAYQQLGHPRSFYGNLLIFAGRADYDDSVDAPASWVAVVAMVG